MTFHAELRSLLKMYVTGALDVEKFAQSYDELYLDKIEPSNIDTDDPDLWKLLSDLFNTCDLFEPHPGIRKESPNYIGPDELDKSIRGVAKVVLA